jgi:hypothetical protein
METPVPQGAGVFVWGDSRRTLVDRIAARFLRHGII